MPKNPLPEGKFSANSIGYDDTTRRRVHARTCELAARAGRPYPHVRQADYEQAQREVKHDAEIERQTNLRAATAAPL